MNKLIALLLTASLSFLSAGTVAAERVSSSAAASYVGDMVTVSGTVSQVTTSGNGTTFINYGGRYPNHHFYGVVFRDNSRAFGSLRNLEGKKVSLTGVVEIYEGKPQIILESPGQIRVD